MRPSRDYLSCSWVRPAGGPFLSSLYDIAFVPVLPVRVGGHDFPFCELLEGRGSFCLVRSWRCEVPCGVVSKKKCALGVNRR